MYLRLGMSIGFEKPVLKPKFWDGFETGLKSLKPVLIQYYKMVKTRSKRALQKLKIIITNITQILKTHKKLKF